MITASAQIRPFAIFRSSYFQFDHGNDCIVRKCSICRPIRPKSVYAQNTWQPVAVQNGADAIGNTMKTFLFELCVESLGAAQVAETAGAHRIELCSQLEVGGVTPPLELTRATVEAISLPVHVLIRPRGGSFHYSEEEFAVMCQQTLEAKAAGAAGAALGVLLADRRVDGERTRRLVELASPMKVTFHRAFDEVPELGEALEAVIRSGADCLLTSGGAANVMAGAESIASLRQQAGERLEVMAGGGLRIESLVEVLRRTGVSHLHGSLQRGNVGNASARTQHRVDLAQLAADLRKAVRLIEGEISARADHPGLVRKQA